MSPNLFHVGPISVDSYTAVLGLGLFLGLVIIYRRAGLRIARRERWLDGALVALAAGVLGARLGFVAANWTYYEGRTGQILKFWLGGLEWRGALVGATLATLIYCWARKLQFWRLADELALVAPLVGVAGWVGCLLAGCAYGEVLDQPHWLAADLPDIFGVWALRYNVQLLAVGWSLNVGLVLWWAQRRLPAGGTFALFLMLFGAGMGIIDSLRGDVSPLVRGWRSDVLADWIVASLGLVTMGLVSLKRMVTE